tara:strand:- start:227 stop:610 length:384 start_codon:yes stop_codon:yes gene_type:complete
MVIRPEFDTSERNMEPIRPNDPNRMDELTQNDRGDVQKAYRVEELTTSGWELLNEKAQQLPREQAKIWLDWGLNEGISPQSLRAIPEKPVRENHPALLKKPERQVDVTGDNVTINVSKGTNVTINET